MPKREAPLEYLRKFIPAGSEELALHYLEQYRVHLTITRERTSILGDYRHATHHKAHRISVNGNLNKYSFLITLIHEIAHLVAFIEYGNNIQAHGREWKVLYGEVLKHFMRLNIFPYALHHALLESINNLPASSCSDEDLMRELKKFDAIPNGMLMVEELQEGKLFKINKGQIFKKGKKLRKRYQCVEVKTGKIFLFSAVYEVKAV